METSIPLALKYRPKKLADVVGQDIIVRILTNSFKSKNWHHAYILEGLRGSGKTTTSRIMAAMENCEKGPTLEPCGKCRSCQEIFSGKSQDIKEIDAASKRSIEDVRAMQEDILTCPIYNKIKYVIIDEAHGWTGYAADAALKMIEEPPPHVRFILCTTQPESFKATIPSRCITLNFKKIDWREIQNHLNNVCKMEDIQADASAVKLIARSSGGSIRDSLQNLQTVIDYAGGDTLNEEMVQKVLGAISDDVYFSFIQAMIDVNAPEVMKIANKLLASGGNVSKVVDGLIAYIRNIQLYLTSKDQIISEWLSADEIKKIAHNAQYLKPSLTYIMLNYIRDELKRGILVNMPADAALESFAIGIMMEMVKRKKAETKGD